MSRDTDAAMAAGFGGFGVLGLGFRAIEVQKFYILQETFEPLLERPDAMKLCSKHVWTAARCQCFVCYASGVFGAVRSPKI